MIWKPKKCTNYDHAQTEMDLKLQQFYLYMRNGGINIHNIWIDNKLAYFVTKPLNKGHHNCHRILK